MSLRFFSFFKFRLIEICFLFRRPYGDKSETQPLFTPASSVSPTIPPQITSGTSTINRTLLHHQQPEGRVSIPTPGNHQSATLHGRNGSTGNSGMRGSGYSGDSPPPDYNIVVHGNRHGFFLYYFF